MREPEDLKEAWNSQLVMGSVLVRPTAGQWRVLEAVLSAEFHHSHPARFREATEQVANSGRDPMDTTHLESWVVGSVDQKNTSPMLMLHGRREFPLGQFA